MRRCYPRRAARVERAAATPAGWIPCGLDEDLEEAAIIPLDGLLDRIALELGIERRLAMS